MVPEIVEGYRGPRGEHRPKAERDTGKVIPTGMRLFQFRASRYRLQLTAPTDDRLPDGRIKKADKALVVVADEFFKLLDSEKDKAAIAMLEQHPDYGVDFWDFADTLKQKREEKEREALKVLQDPVSRAKIIEALRASGDDDFSLPASGKAPADPAKAATPGK